METILSSLNALVEKLGGDTSDNKLIVDALNDISEKFGGDADNKMIVDALNNIVENYSGGGGVEYPLREITIINNSSASITLWGDIQISNDVAENKLVLIGAGKTVVTKIVASRLITSGYQKQAIVFAQTANANEPTITGDYITVLGHVTHSEQSGVVTTTTRYTTVRIEGQSPKDITITIS